MPNARHVLWIMSYCTHALEGCQYKYEISDVID